MEPNKKRASTVFRQLSQNESEHLVQALPVALIQVVEPGLGVTPRSAGVTPGKTRGNAVEISALPRGNFGVTATSHSCAHVPHLSDLQQDAVRR